MRIAINGMGRIGRLLFRRLVGHEAFELVAINDIMEPDNLAYLLKYDSVYGTFPDPITLRDDDEVAGKWPVDCHPAAARSDQAALESIGSGCSTRVFGPLYQQGRRFCPPGRWRQKSIAVDHRITRDPPHDLWV